MVQSEVPEIERLSAEIDLRGQYVGSTIGRKSVRGGSELYDGLKKPTGDDFEDEDFATNSSDKGLMDESDNDRIKAWWSPQRSRIQDYRGRTG